MRNGKTKAVTATRQIDGKMREEGERIDKKSVSAIFATRATKSASIPSLAVG